MLTKVASSRVLSIVFAASMLVLVTPMTAWADDADDCASTTVAADRSAAACRRLAEQGKAWAQFNLGLAYENGEGVPKNDKEAVKWYRKAADQGYAIAQYSLGWMYDNGKGVPEDAREAVKWYRKAAEQGHASAQYSLGWMYRDGKGVPQDDTEAVKWYRKAAEQGYARAQNSLGWMYNNGKGVPQDDREAVKWYRKAAEQGYARAQNSLGWMYNNGKGVSEDHSEAVKWYRLAAEQGNADAQYNLGLAYETGLAVTRDLVKAHMWFDLATKAYSAGADRDDAVKHRNRVAAKLTPQQLAKAKKMAAEWKPAPPPAAAREEPCPPNPNAAQTLTIGDPALDENSGMGAPDQTKTLKELTDVAGRHQMVTYGLTSRDYAVNSELVASWHRATTGDGICLTVTDVKLTMTPIRVFLAKELSPGSCAYRVVWSHELTHVRKEHELDLKFRGAIKDAVRNANLPSAGKYELFANLEAGTEALTARINVAISAALGADDPKTQQRLAKDDSTIWYEAGNPFRRGTYLYFLKEHLDSLDSDASYRKVQAECMDWPLEIPVSDPEAKTKCASLDIQLDASAGYTDVHCDSAASMHGGISTTRETINARDSKSIFLIAHEEAGNRTYIERSDPRSLIETNFAKSEGWTMGAGGNGFYVVLFRGWLTGYLDMPLSCFGFSRFSSHVSGSTGYRHAIYGFYCADQPGTISQPETRRLIGALKFDFE